MNEISALENRGLRELSDPLSPREVTERRQPSVNQEAGPHETPNLPVL